MRGGRRTRAGLLLAAGIVALGLLGASIWTSAAWTPPSAADVRRAHVPSDARLLDRRGRLLHEIRVDPRRRVLPWTPLSRVSPALVEAVLRSEDRHFFQHRGVDPAALLAAAWQRLSAGTRRGGSTLSMQLVALLDPSLRSSPGRRRSLGEKLRQARAARALEERWTKDEILEAYLNLVPFRGEVEGVSAAAGVLLGKAPHGIDLAEASILAALLRAPSAPREAVMRRARRLAAEIGPSVAPEPLERAAERIFADPDRRGPTPRLAPHLARRAFAGESAPRTRRSTLDADVQQWAMQDLQREVASIRSHNVRDGAVIVLDNESGDVLAWVGSTGPLAEARHVDGVLARRQAGSTLKPFLYALALDRRIVTAASLLDDGPLEIPIAGAVYRPRNYDSIFHGPVTVRTALASSLNVPAVRALELVGESAFLDRLIALGFTGLVTTGDHYGPSLPLGTPEVSLLELANAYRTLARGGVSSPVRVLEDETRRGAPTRVYSEEAAFVVESILSDRDARSTTFGLENALATSFWTAVKTGTSKEMRDNWCVGFSSDFTVAVWVGNSSGQPMHDVSGITGAAPTWLRVMSRLHRDRPSESPTPPPGLVTRPIELPDGTSRREWFLAGTEPARSRVRLATPPTRISSPVEGSVIALDPDVPEDRQKLVLVASTARADLSWHLDGRPLGTAESPRLWKPTAGRHRLDLRTASGERVDRVGFVVRAAAVRRQ